jgi:hypothetical protein
MRYYILNGNINFDIFKGLVDVDNFILGDVGSFDIEGYLDGLVERGKNVFKREWEEDWDEDGEVYLKEFFGWDKGDLGSKEVYYGSLGEDIIFNVYEVELGG